MVCVCHVLNHIQLFVTLWPIAHQASLSKGFSRQECWSGSPLPTPWDLPDPGIEPEPLILQVDFLPTEPSEKPLPMVTRNKLGPLVSGSMASWPAPTEHPLCCSVVKLCLTLCDPMDCSTLGFPVFHYFPEFAQIHVHWVSDAIQPSHSLPPSPPLAFSLS